MSALAVALAAGLDAAVGEPPDRFHPVAWFGRAVAPLDRDWRRPRLVGAVGTLCLPLGAAGAVGTVILLATVASAWLGGFVAALALFVTTSRRRLVASARGVVAASEADPALARERLPALAGRDPGGLSPAHLRSAAVESAAENLADGLVAPLLAFALVAAAAALAGPPLAPPFDRGPALLAPAAGAAGAAWVKAVNTMDSMLGYRSKPVGWAPARLDDLVMWLPARLSAALLAAAAGRPDALLGARPHLAAVPSPNSGWPMATIAVAHGCRLAKPGVYAVGSGALPDAGTAEAAIGTVARAGALAYLLAVLALALGIGIAPATAALPEVIGWS